MLERDIALYNRVDADSDVKPDITIAKNEYIRILENKYGWKKVEHIDVSKNLLRGGWTRDITEDKNEDAIEGDNMQLFIKSPLVIKLLGPPTWIDLAEYGKYDLLYYGDSYIIISKETDGVVAWSNIDKNLPVTSNNTMRGDEVGVQAFQGDLIQRFGEPSSIKERYGKEYWTYGEYTYVINSGTHIVTDTFWGKSVYVHGAVNIRRQRSTNSAIVKKLLINDQIKIDFCKNDWCAVFDVKEESRNEKLAKGYIYKKLTHDDLHPYFAKLDRLYDDIEGIMWFKDQRTPSKHATTLYPYIGKKGNNKWMRLVIQYSSNDWLFVNKYVFVVDGKKYTIDPGQFSVKRDNDTGGIYEWYDILVDAKIKNILNKIIEGKNPKMRYYGNKYYRDKNINDDEIKIIKNILQKYNDI